MSEDAAKLTELEAWAHELVNKIVDAERMGGGFRLYFETAEREIVAKIRVRREALPDAVRPQPELVGFQRWVIGAYDKRIPWEKWAAAKYDPRRLGDRRKSLPLFNDQPDVLKETHGPHQED